MAGSKSAGMIAAKTPKQLQTDMDKLQAAMRKLKNGSNIDLSALPIYLPNTAIAGKKTHAEKMKVLKAAIQNAHMKIANSAGVKAASLSAIQEDKVVESLSQDPATPTHNMPLRSHARPDSSTEWKLVAPQNPRAARKAAARASSRATKLELSVEAEEKVSGVFVRTGASAVMELDEVEGIGWQNMFHQGLRAPLGIDWADDVQGNIDRSQQEASTPAGGKKFKYDGVHTHVPVSKAATKQLRSEKIKKPDKKVKDDAFAALAALAGESVTVIEVEALKEHSDFHAGALPTHPAFCGDQLGLPIGSLIDKINQQTQLELAATRREEQQIAEACALARTNFIKELSSLFPAAAKFVRITLVGYASHSRTSILGLPEKVQEQIYRLVVVEDGPVCITPSNHKQPALLRTCQQLRMEALWIFKNENTFSIEVVDSQPLVPKNYTTHWVRQVVCKLDTKGTPNWTRFKKWLRAYHEDGVPGLDDQGDDRSMPWDICAQAFKLVLSLRKIFPDMTFEEMEPMLEVWKKTVSLQQVNWSWD